MVCTFIIKLKIYPLKPNTNCHCPGHNQLSNTNTGRCKDMVTYSKRTPNCCTDNWILMSWLSQFDMCSIIWLSNLNEVTRDTGHCDHFPSERRWCRHPLNFEPFWWKTTKSGRQSLWPGRGQGGPRGDWGRTCWSRWASGNPPRQRITPPLTPAHILSSLGRSYLICARSAATFTYLLTWKSSPHSSNLSSNESKKGLFPEVGEDLVSAAAFRDW